jgi:hypothetical protein
MQRILAAAEARAVSPQVLGEGSAFSLAISSYQVLEATRDAPISKPSQNEIIGNL